MNRKKRTIIFIQTAHGDAVPIGTAVLDVEMEYINGAWSSGYIPKKITVEKLNVNCEEGETIWESNDD